MIRRAAALAFAVALAGCRLGEVRTIPSARAAGLPSLPSTEPTLAVGIVVSDTAVRVSADTRLDIYDSGEVVASVTPGSVWRFTTGETGTVTGAGLMGEANVRSNGTLQLQAEGGRIRVGEGDYRGHLRIIASPDSGVTVVNVIALETYLRGVVPLEIGSRPPEELEAVKAQAVAARTYALANLGSRQNEGFDVYATVFDQVYGGISAEDPVATQAILDTRGELITYDGRPIIAYYSSTCGGRTGSIEEVWPWLEAQPYLKSVSDRIPGTDRFYCDISNRWSWTTTWDRPQLLAVLGETLRLHTADPALAVGRVTRVAMMGRNASDRISIAIDADAETYHLRADSLRWVLRPEPGPRALNSAVISDLRSRIEDGEISHLEVHGSGWGHGVGMCQVGAWGRARAGQSYREILTTYYQGVEIRRLY